MYIIDKAGFLKLPIGTVYSRYEPCITGTLEVFEGDMDVGDRSDYTYTMLSAPMLDNDRYDAIKKLNGGGKARACFENEVCRDGCFDQEEQFFVWEKEDVKGLVAKLQESLEDAYKE